MLVKIYWIAWALLFASAMLLFASVNFTMMTAVILGFISLGLTFMGMMSVLPATIAHPAAVKEAAIVQAEKIKVNPSPSKTFGVLESAKIRIPTSQAH